MEELIDSYMVGKRQLWRPMCGWNIRPVLPKIDLREIGCEIINWIRPDRYTAQW